MAYRKSILKFPIPVDYDPKSYSDDYWRKNCDPRTVDFWLMSNGPWRLIAITCAYLFLVFFGTFFLKHRQPMQLRYPMLFYNILLVVINIYFLIESIFWMDFGYNLLDFKFPSNQDRSVQALRMVNGFHLYQWSKFLDYFDTFFFVLRKKHKQLTILHIYHHISVPIIGWISLWVGPTMPVLGLFTLINCFCHVIMYSYYALSSLGPFIQPYLVWKKYITQIQLIQFLIIGTYGLLLFMFHTGYPLIYRLMPLSQAIIFLFMFGNFYIRSYLKRQKLN